MLFSVIFLIGAENIYYSTKVCQCTKVMPIVVYVDLFPNFSLLLITVHTCVLLYFEEEY